MLTAREKLSYQKTVRTCAEQLKAGVSNARERLSVQKSMREALAVLKGTVADAKSLLERFVAGEFTKANEKVMWQNFCKVFYEAGEKLDILKDALLKFFDYHAESPVLESANNDSHIFNLGEGILGTDSLHRLMALIHSGAKGSITINLE